MLRFPSSFRTAARFVGWAGILAAVACLGSSGCSNLTTYREDGFADLNPTDHIRYIDPVNRPQGDSFAVSEKAKQIDRNLGRGL